MRLKPSSPLPIFLALLLVAGGTLAYTQFRGGPLVAGAIEISPAEVTLTGSGPATFTLRNGGDHTLTVDVAPPDWIVADPVQAVVEPARSLKVTLSAVAPATTERHVVVTAGTDLARLPVTLQGTVNAAPGTGGPVLEIGDGDVAFPRGVSAVAGKIANRGGAPLEWSLEQAPAWLAIEPSSGEVAPGGAAAVTLRADRSGLPIGETKGKLTISSNGGNADVSATVTTGADPIISLPEPLLDFGVGKDTKKTLTFPVSNTGRAPLTYQASVDRVFLELGRNASLTLPPGKTARVELTFDFKETKTSYDWTAIVPISSNGGSAVLNVKATSDMRGPALVRGSNNLDEVHDHCSGGTCERYRHLSVTVEDQREVVLVKAAYRVCSGPGDAEPACGKWGFAGESRRVSGNAIRGTYEMDVGPLTSDCVPGVGVIVHYRFEFRDGFENRTIHPGTNTWYGQIHCSRAD